MAGDGAPVADPADLSITVRTYFIDHDNACRIAAVAAERRGPVGKLQEGEERDLLADVADALGPDERVKAVDVAARLRELAPGYGPYERLNGKRLAEMLEGLGVEVPKYDGHQMVWRERVYAALDAREDADQASE